MSRSGYLALLCLASLLAACGNKGPLVKPGDSAKPAPAQPAPAAATPAPVVPAAH